MQTRIVFPKSFNTLKHLLFFSTLPPNPSPNPNPWHAALARRGLPAPAAATIYFCMRAAAVAPTTYTFALLINSAATTVHLAGELHGQALKCGAAAHLVVKNSLLKMYCNLGLLPHARNLFDESPSLDSISWNTMISAYGKSGDVVTARALFDTMPQPNLISWSAVIDAYVKNGDYFEALALFNMMQRDGVRPDVVTLVSALKACAHLGALDQGRWIHHYVDRFGIGRGNVVLDTAFVDMYCKCGCVEEALQVFGAVRVGDVVLWNAMIGGLAMHGHGERALGMFHRMRYIGFVPNESTFIAVLCACTHMGRVDEGKGIFELMTREYGIDPRREHYGCLADLLGRAGRVEEAENVLLDMPMEPHAAQWGALMSSCRMHNKLEVGERAGKQLIELEPDDGGRYVILANLYAANGRWDDAKCIRRTMEERGAKKETGCSFIEWNGIVHEFIVGDMTHPQSGQIYALLEEMEKRLGAIGYVKDTSQVLIDMDEEEDKGNALSYHSEKLALAFGIINIDHGLPIRIVKNLRVCRDCHTHAKLVSKLYRREIIVRDRHRFHKFKDGLCSCNDYW